MTGYAALAEPWWIPLVWILAVGHVTNICNTLFLHRSITHGGVRFHPLAEHFMRFWIWLTTGIVTREWVAIHRKHHAYSDRHGDPHSPEVEGLAAILFTGVFFYQKAAKDTELLEKYGRGCPDDWVERNVYTRFRTAGLALALGLTIYLFGLWIGLLVWSVMAIWMPIMGNIINGIGHAKGYRNFRTKDHSHNIYPWGIWILGEELHNNHHADPRSAKFKAHWWEFDIGWFYIRILAALGLADVVYARDMSPRAFAAKYYGGGSRASASTAATSTATTAKARLGTERAGRSGAADRLRLTSEAARQELEEAIRKLERAAARARAGAASARAGAVSELEEARRKLERAAASARDTAREELEEAMQRLERASASARAGVREELEEAKRRLEEVAASARAGLEPPEPITD